MVKINNKVLNKFNKDLGVVTKEIEVFENDVITVNKNKLSDLKQELMLKNKELEKIKIDGIKDTVKFLNIRNDIQLLEQEIRTLEGTVDFSNSMFDEYTQGKYDNMYQKYFDVDTDTNVYQEYKDNMLLLQKEMFKKFLEIEELCNQMDTVTEDYKYSFEELPHRKLNYITVSSYPYKNKVHQRFNLNRIVGYYTGVTTEKEDFEY